MTNFVFACASVNGLTLNQKRETIKALRESIKAEVAEKRSHRLIVKAEKAGARAAKKAARIAKLEEKLANLKNPVGTKARKAAKKPGAVKVFSPDEIAEANAISAKFAKKKAA